MKAVFLSFLTLFVWLLCPPVKSYSQPTETSQRFTVWGGYSATSVYFLGKTRNAQTQLMAFGYQKVLQEYKPSKFLWYTADVIPYLHFDYPKRDENDRRTTRQGLGFSPVGFMATNHISRFINPFARTTGGVILMNDTFPTDGARNLNFTFDITLGNSITLDKQTFFSFGYKFHHISNAQTGSENPGLDSNFFFLKISIQ